jgi:hypothetical protein
MPRKKASDTAKLIKMIEDETPQAEIMKKMAQFEHIDAIEKRLWSAADTLRTNSNYAGNEYFLPVMGLVFLRHAYSRFLGVKDAIEAGLPTRGGKTRPLTKEDFSQKSAIFLQPKAQFDTLVALPDSADRAKPNLTSGDIKRTKAVAVDLLETLKAEKLWINHWRDKESTRDAVRLTIQYYLWSEQTGLPETYSEEDARDKTEAVFVHVFRAYPTVPSPYYASMAS